MMFPSSLEPLEARIAPATLVKPNVVTFTDVDGDLVTVKVTKGTFDPSLVEFTFMETSPGREQLIALNLSDSKFSGANVSITAKRSAQNGGDGFVNVGLINGNDGGTQTTFGSIVVDGDLGALRTGEAAAGKLALKSLTLGSLGAYGLSTQGGSGSLDTTIRGAAGKITVKGDVFGTIQVMTPGDGSLAALKVGGSLIGGPVPSSGSVLVFGSIGSVQIGGSILGGPGENSANVSATKTIGNVSIGGSIIGLAPGSAGVAGINGIGAVVVRGNISSGGIESSFIRAENGPIKSLTVGGTIAGSVGTAHPGQIYALETLGPVKIGGNLRGGGFENSGRIAAGSITSVKIGGSLTGSSGKASGAITALDGGIGPVTIGGNFEATSGIDSGWISGRTGIKSVTIGGSMIRAGDTRIESSNGAIGSVKIAGDLISIGGVSAIQAAVSNIASISVGGDIRAGANGQPLFFASGAINSVTVKGSILGSPTVPVVISAGNTIGKVNVTGSIEYGIIRASEADGTIGPVTVGRDFVASRIAAGTTNGGDGIPGTSDDMFIGGGDPGKLSSIAKVTIKGHARGTVGGIDSFFIIAEKIGKITVGGTGIPLADTPGDIPIGTTEDLFIRDRTVM